MVNRYIGNTGRVQRIPEPHQQEHEHVPEKTRGGGSHPIQKPPPKNLGGGLNHSVQRLMQRMSSIHMEQEDIILLLILYLLYRESGDPEFLITLAAFVLL